MSMRNDATEAALGLLGLTGSVSFAAKTTTINGNGSIRNGMAERDGGRERATAMKRKTSSNSNSSSSTTTAAFSLPLPHAHTPSYNHRRRGSIPPPTPSDDGDTIRTLSASATTESTTSLATTATGASHAPTTKTANHPGRRAAMEDGSGAGDDDSSDAIRCICGFSYDDGFSIACDDCSRWVHAACFGIVEGGDVPEEWRCWECEPRPVDKERAVRLQRARLKMIRAGEGANGNSGGGRRRVNSPGVDRKRRASAAAIDGGAGAKRKRRYSVNNSTQHNHPSHPSSHQHPAQQQQPNAEDEHVDIEEPAAAAHTYIHIDRDIVPTAATRDRLQRAARHWRGVVALDGERPGSPAPTSTTSTTTSTPALPSSAHLATPVLLPPSALHSPTPTALHALPPITSAFTTAFTSSTPTSPSIPDASESVRPPTYAVHTTQAVRSASLIAPFAATVMPSAAYLADPLNAYAHLGLPKPFVHLMGPPLDVALDARLAGNGTRFVRSGCRPNAVLRPVLCHPREGGKKANGKENRDGDAEDSLAFGVFALRDLRANEEVVLGWEWDDGSVIHHLPALIDSPHLFAPGHIAHFRHQMTSMLHALASTFTTCACGARARDCALTRLAEFVDGSAGVPPTPSPSPPSQFAFADYRHGPVPAPPQVNANFNNHPNGNGYAAPSNPPRPKDADYGRDNKEMGREREPTDLGPLVGVARGFRTRERVPGSGGMCGVEMVREGVQVARGWEGARLDGDVEMAQAGPSRVPGQEKTMKEREGVKEGVGKPYDRKGKGRAIDEDEEKLRPVGNRRARRRASSQSQSQAQTQPRGRAGRSRSRSPARVVPQKEALLPPKLRKKWIHESAEGLKEVGADARAKEDVAMDAGADVNMGTSGGVDGVKYEPPRAPDPDLRVPVRPPDKVEVDADGDVDMDKPTVAVDDTTITMPPPPLPSFASLPPPSIVGPEVTSPTASFANLSLLSPLVNGPSPHFPGSFRSMSASRSSASASPAPPSAPTSEEQSPVVKSLSPVVQPKLSALVMSPSAPPSEVLPEAISRREPEESPPRDPSPVQPTPSPTISVKPIPELVYPESPKPQPTETGSAEDPHGLFDSDEMVTESSAMVVDVEEPHAQVQSPVSPKQEESAGKPEDDAVMEERPSPTSPPPLSSLSPTPPHEPAPAVQEPNGTNPAADGEDVAMAVEEHPAVISSDDTAVTAAEADADKDAVKVNGEAQPSPTVEEPPPVQPPPAPHKVKMSLKDFAMRKKKQREEEEKEKAHASPVVPAVLLSEQQIESAQPAQVDAQPEQPLEPPSDTPPVATPVPEVQHTESLVEEVRVPEATVPSPEAVPVDRAPSPDHRDSTLIVTDPRTKNRAPSPRAVPEFETPSKGAPEASFKAKVELIESSTLGLPPPPSIREPSPPPRSPKPRSPSATPTPPSSRNKKENEPAIAFGSGPGSLQVVNNLSRTLSQEDGEILSPPAPKALPLVPPLGPRAHSPPTHPRGFHSHMGGVSPSRPPPRRPLQPPSYRPQLNMPLSSRPLPSGPRALRGANGGSHYSPMPSANSRQMGGPHLAPRAPSADRDRDRMDWDRDRGRVGSWGRGRPSSWR
ncbi:hypothetical protein EIP86_011447 [Pleurotus ostreatoroseus]|nr:hypothetical protein EIP86_011447 [Pleurotus ostreatoroseus]